MLQQNHPIVVITPYDLIIHGPDATQMLLHFYPPTGWGLGAGCGVDGVLGGRWGCVDDSRGPATGFRRSSSPWETWTEQHVSHYISTW